MKWTIDMTDRQIHGVDIIKKRELISGKRRMKRNMLQKHPPWAGIQFHPSSGFTAIGLLFYPHAFPQHFIFIAYPQTFVFVVSCHSVQCQFNFKNWRFLSIQDDKYKLYSPGSQKQGPPEHIWPDHPSSRLDLMWCFLCDLCALAARLLFSCCFYDS